MGLTRQQKLYYYKNRKIVEHLIREYARKKQISLYGSRAINLNVPAFLESHTEDFDFYHKNPRQIAREVERHLDRFFEGNYFKVMKAKYPKTYRVVSNVTKKSVMDVTKPDKPIPTKRINGMRVSTKKHLKKMLRKSLKKKSAKFRHKRDKERLQALNLANQNNSNSLNDFVYRGIKNARGGSVNHSDTQKKKKKEGKISLW